MHHDAGKLLQQLRAAEGRLAQLAVPPVVLALAAQDALLVRHKLVDVLQPRTASWNCQYKFSGCVCRLQTCSILQGRTMQHPSGNNLSELLRLLSWPCVMTLHATTAVPNM